jgi:membrane protein YqaA with SNARE-associated domain
MKLRETTGNECILSNPADLRETSQPSIQLSMLFDFVQVARRPRNAALAVFRHWGAFGLFFLAILDSLPIPSFGGPDILTVILVVTRHNPWYEYAATATAGSVVGAYIVFKMAHRAGRSYIDSKFRQRRVMNFLKIFERWGTGALVASAAIPFPSPTSIFFAAAGASNNYSMRKFVIVVGLSRAVRYSAVAIIAHLYGRHIIRVFRHPTQYWGWLLVFAVIFAAVVVTGILINRRLADAEAAALQPPSPVEHRTF